MISKNDLFLFILIIGFTLFSCTREDYIPSNKQTLVNEVRNRVADQLKKERDLIPFGTGGQIMDGIKMLALAFNYYKPISLEEARELLVFSANRFVNEVNADARIHVYITKYPFKPQNIDLAIYLLDQKGHKVAQGDLRVISISEGKLRYQITDPKTDLLKTIHTETYEEAVQKLGELKEPLVVPPFSPDPSGGRVYNPPKKQTTKAPAST